MTFQKIYWETSFTVIVLFFTLYTVAKDYIANSDVTFNALRLALPFWLILLIALLLPYMYFKPKE